MITEYVTVWSADGHLLPRNCHLTIRSITAHTASPRLLGLEVQTPRSSVATFLSTHERLDGLTAFCTRSPNPPSLRPSQFTDVPNPVRSIPFLLRCLWQLTYSNCRSSSNSRSDIPAVLSDYDEVTGHPHRPLSPRGTSASGENTTPAPPVMIACVPDSPLSCWNVILIVTTASRAQLEAGKHP